MSDDSVLFFKSSFFPCLNLHHHDHYTMVIINSATLKAERKLQCFETCKWRYANASKRVHIFALNLLKYDPHYRRRCCCRQCAMVALQLDDAAASAAAALGESNQYFYWNSLLLLKSRRQKNDQLLKHYHNWWVGGGGGVGGGAAAILIDIFCLNFQLCSRNFSSLYFWGCLFMTQKRKLNMNKHERGHTR